MAKNLIIDTFIKLRMPQTWDRKQNRPTERVLSFICSIVNTRTGNFVRTEFRRNPIEISIVPDSDGNSKNDRYRASRSKINEEYVILASLDMRQLVDRLYDKYKDEISMEEIEYYRRNMQPSRLHQWMIEIYFHSYTGSSYEFPLLRNIDWFKLLLIMRHDIMKRLGVDNNTLLDSVLPLMLTSNIEERPVGEKTYLKDMKYLKDDPSYILLSEKYYSMMVAIDENQIKKFLIIFANSKYKFVLFEEKDLLNQEITVNKRQLIDELMTFLILSNEDISVRSISDRD